ncbi:MAG: hypothetical protein IJQ14_07355 [Bacteroidales bacterium]|nr:hypothetical protein [Bacteroidales bacterium]
MSMSDNHSHRHHHHKEDYGSRFKRQSLSSIAFRRSVAKWMKIILFALSVVMILLVILTYVFL